jgi:hypothetical protein
MVSDTLFPCTTSDTVAGFASAAYTTAQFETRSRVNALLRIRTASCALASWKVSAGASQALQRKLVIAHDLWLRSSLRTTSGILRHWHAVAHRQATCVVLIGRAMMRMAVGAKRLVWKAWCDIASAQQRVRTSGVHKLAYCRACISNTWHCT